MTIDFSFVTIVHRLKSCIQFQQWIVDYYYFFFIALRPAHSPSQAGPLLTTIDGMLNNQFSLHWLSNDIKIRNWAQNRCISLSFPTMPRTNRLWPHSNAFHLNSMNFSACFQKSVPQSPRILWFSFISFRFFTIRTTSGKFSGHEIVPSRILWSVCTAAISIEA